MSEQQLNLNCAVKACPAAPGDLTIYNLQDALYFNGTALSVLAQCPAGYFCPPGLFPRVFTYPPGTFVVVIPPLNTGFPIVISIVGCESTLNTVLPAGSSQSQAQAAADILIAEAAAQQARCDALTLVGPPLPIQINLSDIFEYACVDVAASLAISGSSTPARSPISFVVATQPAWLVSAQNATTLFLDGTPTAIGVYNFSVTATAPGTPPGSGLKNYTLNVVGIVTASPLTAGTVGAPYSETLDASSIPGVLTWAVTGGALPDGLTLDSGTGEISGTPTVDAAFNFTISAGNGTISCSKAFALTVAAAAGCVITTASPLPNAIPGTYYGIFIDTTGLTAPETWSVIAGAMPAWMSFQLDGGSIFGTPTSASTGIYNFTMQVTDGIVTCQKAFQITVEPAPIFPSLVYTDLFANNTQLSACTINGYDKMAGLPLDGTELGASITVNWTTVAGFGGYTIAFTGSDTALTNDGNWRFTVNNTATLPADFGPRDVRLYLNGALIFTYDVETTTGAVDHDFVVALLDVVDVTFSVSSGPGTINASYSTSMVLTQLP